MIALRALILASAVCAATDLGCARATPARPSVQTPATSDRNGAEWFAEAVRAGARGDSSRAEQYALLARRAGYAEERVLALLLRVCIEASRLRAARGHARPYLARHPEAWRLRYLLATIDLALGETERARAELERIVREHPEASAAGDLLAGLLHPEEWSDP